MNIRNLAMLPALCALGTGVAFAQSATPTPHEAKTSHPGRFEYRSVFSDYRAYRDPAITDWRTSNETVGRLQGHMGHLGGAAAPSTTKATDGSADPSARRGHDHSSHPGGQR